MAPSNLYFKIKLPSGRVLGPLNLNRIRSLVFKNQITGKELAREYPVGEWKDINVIPILAEILLSHAEGRLKRTKSLGTHAVATGASVQATVPVGPTHVLPGASPATIATPELVTLSEVGEETRIEERDSSAKPSLELVPSQETLIAKKNNPENKTVIQTQDAPSPEAPLSDMNFSKVRGVTLQGLSHAIERPERPPEFVFENHSINERSTVIFQGYAGGVGAAKKKSIFREKLQGFLIAVALGVIGYQVFLTEPEKKEVLWVPIRPALPVYEPGRMDPSRSAKIYEDAMKYYVKDTVLGYKAAADKLRVSASLDGGNVKALAMLASSYLNLIDSSNKDENYFSVISRLIEMSRAKNVELPETVIADVEFYITANKAEAAQNRIVEYTKTHQNFGLEMFYYLGFAFFNRGDFKSAARFLGQFPDNKVYSAKILYLKGQVAEALGDPKEALIEYEKAVKFNREHVKSRLRIADIYHRAGKLQNVAGHLDFIINHNRLLAPKDLALAYYLHAQLSELYRKMDIALGDMERAVRLDKDNHEYLMLLYRLRGKAGESLKSVKKDARMYFFLGEGEKFLKEGRYQEALVEFLQARQANGASPIPLLKIGDMFTRLHDLGNARVNYQMAAERAPEKIEIWSKYIDNLIQSYEWDEAQKAMDRFRKLPVNQSAIDKAAADMYAKQSRHTEAQTLYRKAMSRDVIDRDVYLAYAKSLMAARAYKEAPFFFALALRFDPLNTDAIVGTAKCTAETESIDRAISMVQDELQKGTGARAELLSAIAELKVQKGSWEEAQEYVNQAMAANVDYAQPWKLQALIHLNGEGIDKNFEEKALSAYKSYSDRNTSDPSGYLERYKIFVKKRQFDKAGDELAKIYGVYPKYPNLHLYKAVLYSAMGNHRLAIEEYKIELANNPGNVTTLVALGKELVAVGAASDALPYFNQAMQAAPKAAEPKHQAAYANYLLKNLPGAIALYNAALVYDSGNPVIYKRLGLALLESGNRAGASQAFRKYLEMEPDAPDRAEIERFL